jgi:hypothetical protein
MKYKVKSDGIRTDDTFEIYQVEIVREKTRARIVTWSVGVWLLLLLFMGIRAAMSGQRDNFGVVLNVLTPIVTTGFGWYLCKQTSK